MTTTTLYWPDKTSREILDYGLDWTAALAPNELLQSSVWEVEPGLSVLSNSITGAGRFALIWLSGGTPKTRYRLTNLITTNQGRRHETIVFLTIS
jgi:hypothetical protein